MLPVDRNNPSKKTLQIFIYQIGRLAAYGSLGLLFSLVGKGFYAAGYQQQLSIIIGLLMIIVALVPKKEFAKYNFSKPIYKIISKVKSSLGAQFKNKSYKSLFIIGLLNGYLPCGMVYVALFGAIAMPTTTQSIGYMILFGLGTIPMMSAIVYISNLITLKTRNYIQKIIPLVAVIIGMLFIIRGLGLDIPYISPSNTNLFVQPDANCH